MPVDLALVSAFDPLHLLKMMLTCLIGQWDRKDVKKGEANSSEEILSEY
jgi:hypothetical protein